MSTKNEGLFGWLYARGGSTGSRTGCNLKTCAWRHGMADAAWLHSFCVWTSHCVYLCLYLDYAYPYLHLYVRGTVHCLLAYCRVNPKNWSLWWKLGGTAVKKPQVWSPLGLYRHVIISFMTFWPCRTSSDCMHCTHLSRAQWLLHDIRSLASSPGRFFANITAGEKYVILAKNRPADEATLLHYCTIRKMWSVQERRSRSGRGGHGRPTFWANFFFQPVGN